MCYYTITTQLHDKEGHTQALMIIDAEDEEMAKSEYIKTFKLYEYNVNEGIHIPDGFQCLLTEPIKRTLYKYANSQSDMPLVSYSNRIHIKFDT